MTTKAKRLSYDEAAEQLMLAGTALSTLNDEDAPPRVQRIARTIDAVIGQSMKDMAEVYGQGIAAEMVVARISGAVRVAGANLAALREMPEARPYRSSVEMLTGALEAFGGRP